jgi:hypothetical protein
MAGYSKIYCVGGLGGFMGSDGINPIAAQLWLGEGNRQWWEAHYFAGDLAPLGQLETMVPQKPDQPDALLDACLAFVPTLFARCPSLVVVRDQAATLTRLDFDLEPDAVPAAWTQLREEARAVFADLVIFEGVLVPVAR